MRLAALAVAVAISTPAEADEPNGSDDEAVALEAEGETIIIEDSAPLPRENAAERRIDGAEAAEVAGIQGDAVKAVQTFGGVARAAAGTDGIIVWGAAPADTRLYIDDVPVPRLFHLGGGRSVVPTHMVSSLSLTPGGAGARYGRAIGGAVSVRTGVPNEREFGVYAGADPVDTSVGAHTRISNDTWLAADVRRSLLSTTFETIAPKRASELIPIPNYWDYQVRGSHVLENGDELALLVLGSEDSLQRGIPSLTPDAGFRERVRSSFFRLGLRLTRRRHDGTTTVLSGWTGVDIERNLLDFGGAGDGGGDTISARDNRTMVGAGALLSEERRVHQRVLLRMGLDIEVRRSRLLRDGAISLPTREGDVAVFGQPPGNRVNRDSWSVRRATVGSFVSAAVDATSVLSIEPGLRFEPGFIDGNRILPVRPTEPAVGYTDMQIALDPRLRVNLDLGRFAQLYSAAGRYHQQPAARDLSPVFGSPLLEQATAWQLLVGVISRPTRELTVEIAGFAVRQAKLAVRSELATPPIAGLLDSQGRGRTVGVQTSLRLRRGAVAAWASYTYMRAQRRDHPGERWRLFDGDQSHGLQATASWHGPAGMELGGRFELASGFPRTAVTGAVFNAQSQAFDPIFGVHNGQRLPSFASLSARIAWRHEASWGKAKVWLDIQNVTNRSNSEEVFYSADFTRRGHVQGLPILPVLGAEVEL